MHAIPELNSKGLREFALITSAVVAGLFGLALPWLFGFGWPLWPWVLAGLLSVLGLLAPAAVRPIYRTWMRFGLLLSKITTPLIMGLVFFLVITPMGLIRRVFARDAMAREFNDEASYRLPSIKSPAGNMENPY
jgi:hypothetical protein